MGCAGEFYGFVEAVLLSSSASLLSGVSWASGGYAMKLTASTVPYSIAVPYSTSVVTTIRSDAGFKYSIDGGAYNTVALGATSLYLSGLSATNHTLAVKTVDRGTHSFRLNPRTYGYYTEWKKSYTLPTSGKDTIEMSFYDDVTAPQIVCDRLVGLYFTGSSSQSIFVGVRYLEST